MKSKRTVKTPKKVKGVKLPQYEFGTYVENPYSDLVENEIALVRAKNKASKNGWVKGLNIAGNLAMQYGTSMMNQGMSEGQGVSSGGFNWGSLMSQGIQGAGAYANAQNSFATGGKVGIPTPIEAEGEEVIETPNGDVSQLKGPSHSEGGIDMVVPSGSEIFSKKLKGADGKSMAERKIDREKKEAKVEKLLKDSPTDMTLKKTLQRTKANNEKVEQTDMMKMQFAKMMADMVQHYALGGVVDSYAYGGPVGDPQYPNGNPFPEIKYAHGLGFQDFKPYYDQFASMTGVKTAPPLDYGSKEFQDAYSDYLQKNSPRKLKKVDNIYGNDYLESSKALFSNIGAKGSGTPTSGTGSGTNPNIDYGAINNYFGNLPISDDAHVSEVTNRPYMATPGIVADGATNKNSSAAVDGTGDDAGKYDWLNSIIGGKNGGMTAGDMVGLFGQLYSTFKPMENTRANRAGDTPNINPFLNYGKDALAKMDQSKEYIKQIRDEQNKDLELSRTSAIKRGRNSARGVNTLRALDLAADANANNTKSQIFNQFAQAMQTIYGQEATLENDQDSKVMQGEYMRDLADRQDRDNYFTQMAQDIATKGAGLQHIGKSFNQIKSRNVTNNVLDSLFPDFDMSGMDGKMRRKLTKTASSNAEFLKGIPDTNVRQTVLTKVDSGEWYIKNNKVYDKSSNEEINLTKN